MRGEITVKRLLAIALLSASAAFAQGYPSKPITFVIPFAAGGDSDLSGRNVAAHASKYLNNTPIVAVNRTGASGAIGAMAVRNAAPDGYTLLVARIATHAILPALDAKLPYKWNEFTMLSLIELNPYLCFVKSDSPYRNAADLVAEIRRSPGKLNFSTAGAGTSQNMASQYLMTLAGLTKDHAVGIHYKGGGEVTTAVLGGQVQFACNNAPTVIPQVKAGTLRALFATPSRLAELPDVPSAAETGYPDMNKIVGWTALMGPPGLPKDVVDKWVEVFARLAADAEWQQGNARLGGIAAIRSPAETEKFVREQYELYDKLVTTLGIRQ
jgi:tripartite-type tricarboxylate transporter receptor subunit TctC